MNSDYKRIERAINYLRKNAAQQPALGDLARASGLSPYHFQRLFRRWAGVSPKQFLQFLTVQHARSLIESSVPVLDTCFEVGLSGPGRLHDHFVTIEAVTPGDIKRQGVGLDIVYGTIASPFGQAFVATTGRGLCALEFVGHDNSRDAVARLRARWAGATIRQDNKIIAQRTRGLFAKGQAGREFKVVVQGTNFQVQVWNALLKIPPGHLCAYGQLAAYIEKPRATRAVASAIGANAIAYLIPCHRVLRAGGEPGGYRWGVERKLAMLARESISAGPPLEPRAPAAAMPG